MNKMWKLCDKPLNNMKSENIDWFKCKVYWIPAEVCLQYERWTTRQTRCTQRSSTNEHKAMSITLTN